MIIFLVKRFEELEIILIFRVSVLNTFHIFIEVVYSPKYLENLSFFQERIHKDNANNEHEDLMQIVFIRYSLFSIFFSEKTSAPYHVTHYRSTVPFSKVINLLKY